MIAVFLQTEVDSSNWSDCIKAAQRDGGHLVLIEGHWRATAYAVAGFTGLVEAFVGSSKLMNEWVHDRFRP